ALRSRPPRLPRCQHLPRFGGNPRHGDAQHRRGLLGPPGPERRRCECRPDRRPGRGRAPVSCREGRGRRVAGPAGPPAPARDFPATRCVPARAGRHRDRDGPSRAQRVEHDAAHDDHPGQRCDRRSRPASGGSGTRRRHQAAGSFDAGPEPAAARGRDEAGRHRRHRRRRPGRDPRAHLAPRRDGRGGDGEGRRRHRHDRHRGGRRRARRPAGPL
ncbi:MAG: hypothetical protein AVDCRST_MAG53-1118, partial [uncultured Solirubrobacteraceae bacterium]